MSLHTKKEFRALAGGVSVQQLSTYTKRGNVIIRDDGYIDDGVDINQKFMRKFQVKNGGQVSVADLDEMDRGRKQKKKVEPKREGIKASASEHPVPPPKPVKVKKEKVVLPTKTPQEVERSMTPAFIPEAGDDLDTRKKKLEVAKLEKGVELLNIDIQKKMGQVIPVDLVKGLVNRLSKSFVVSYSVATERIADDLAHKYGASREDIGKFRVSAIRIQNDAIKESTEIAIGEIEGIVDEYRATKK